MKEALRRAGLRTLIVTLALSGAAASTSEASPIPAQPVYYHTWGSIGDSSGPISYNGVGLGYWSSRSSFISPGSFSLGSFQVGPLPTSASLNYNDTPFHIYAGFSTTPWGPESTVQIDGHLNGSLTGNAGSTMYATISSIETPSWSSPPPFPLSALSINLPQAIGPNAVNGGTTPLTAQLLVAANPSPVPVPEPGSMAIFAVALGGLGLWHRRRAR